MKKKLIGIALLASISSFAYEPQDTSDSPDIPRTALHSECVSSVINSGSKVSRNIDIACENMSSMLDVEAVSLLATVKPLTVSLVKACTGIPSVLEFQCIADKIVGLGEAIDHSAIKNCKY